MKINIKWAGALLLAAFVVPGVTFAQTQSVTDLQAELQNLLAEVASLEAQINAQGGSAPAWCYDFTSNLSIGMSGSAVNALQTALEKDGESVTANGIFDDSTAAAVTAFQEKYHSEILSPYGLSNGTGYAGKSTRAKLDELFGCASPAAVAPSNGAAVNEGSYPVTNGNANTGGSANAGNGKSESVAPPARVPAITDVTSAGATPTPGSNEMIIGTDLPTSDATIVIDPGSSDASLVTPSGYNVGGGGNMTFFLPSAIRIGSHTIEVEEAGGTVSNAYAFTVVAGGVSTPLSATISAGPSIIINGQSVTVAWQSRGAASCTLSGTNGYNDNGPWTQSGLPVSGAKVIIPYPSSTTGYTAQYEIVCNDSAGNSTAATTTVAVNIKG